MSKPMDCFVKLGETITREWERVNCDTTHFAEIAVKLLAESEVLNRITLEDIADWLVIQNSNLPPQRLRDFGQPPINAYCGRDFDIELLIWIDVPTAIHQHAFSGAFGVLRGSSLHSTYAFHASERISDRLELGELRYSQSEVLRRGDVRMIKPGREFIHSLLHLEPPSVSVVVRTGNEQRHQPQFSYTESGIAYDPFYKPEPLSTQIAFLRSMKNSEPAIFHKLACQKISTCDMWYATKLVQIAEIEGVDSNSSMELEMLRDRHSLLASALSEDIARQKQVNELKRAIRFAKTWEPRILLGSLLVAESSETLMQIIHSQFPDSDPIEKVTSILDDLTSIPDLHFSFGRIARLTLEYAMRGLSVDEITTLCANRFGDDNISQSMVEEAWRRLEGSPLLHKLMPKRPSNMNCASST